MDSDTVEIFIRFGLLLSVVFGIPAFFLVRARRRKRGGEAVRRERVRLLTERLGGEFTADPARSWPGSAGRRRPFLHLYHHSGFLGSLRVPHREPEFRFAAEIPHGRWRLRVCEGSILRSGPHNSAYEDVEHIVETRTGTTPGLKLAPVLDPAVIRALGFPGRVRDPRQSAFDLELREPVPSASSWQEVELPEEIGAHVVAYTEDPAFAARVLTPSTLRWLVENKTDLQCLLAFDHGYFYAVDGKPVAAETLPGRLDALAALLDRIGVEATASG
ncbi:hypothetical protein CFN78_01220 [Amycolatopsis antarctica]|uniref:DUF3137 domain-containing protein n=1 Tax=Amycolatopsis antarctica TaxID=1854586 RepID=A0A263D8M1_9PSEU|nr:hypothetical protein [Amycolatopsis antarctica]OZM74864.1 hypothetical protein CFN78_01220 [Amycolatopsis antarctica]